MRMLFAAATLLLSASAAMAEAPCQAPREPACQKACAVMGAKYVLWRREQDRLAPAQVQTVSASSDNPLAAARRLAGFAGLPLGDVDNLPLSEVRQAVEASCPR